MRECVPTKVLSTGVVVKVDEVREILDVVGIELVVVWKEVSGVTAVVI